MTTPTPEQSAIIEAAKTTRDNLIITARAGAAKTTTLEMIAASLNQPMLCLAFNKSIATAMKERLPARCECKTLNALGHRAWMDHTGKRLTLDGQKRGAILRDLIKEERNQEKQAELWKGYRDMLDAVGALAANGYHPPFPGARPLVSRGDLSLPVNFTAAEEELVYRTADEAARQALSGHIDFDDQILMPTIYHASFPRLPLTLIDEAQDLSPLNQEMLAQIVGNRRLIAVGDPAQAIYGFRGADADSMTNLQRRFDMTEMTLTISFRCARSIIESVWWRCPDMRWPDWAEAGSVEHIDTWTLDDIPNPATVLCRNNAPLFRLAMLMLRNGYRPELAGNDLAKTLIKDMKALSGGKKSDPQMPQEAALRALAQWKKEKERRHRGAVWVTDKAEIMHMFLSAEPTLGRACARAEALFKSSGPVKLMTVHKAKGLEWPAVHILNEDLFRNEGQDPNLRYVAATRAKSTIRYLHLDDLLLQGAE